MGVRIKKFVLDLVLLMYSGCVGGCFLSGYMSRGEFAGKLGYVVIGYFRVLLVVWRRLGLVRVLLVKSRLYYDEILVFLFF